MATAALASTRVVPFASRVSVGRSKGLHRTSANLRPTKLRSAPGVAMAAGTPPTPPTYQLLTLDYVPDILEKRDPFRAEHIAGAKAAAEAGKVVLAGALQNPTDAGVFVFKDCDEAFVQNFVENDAYYKAGLVTKVTIRPWMIVVGA